MSAAAYAYAVFIPGIFFFVLLFCICSSISKGPSATSTMSLRVADGGNTHAQRDATRPMHEVNPSATSTTPSFSPSATSTTPSFIWKSHLKAECAVCLTIVEEGEVVRALPNCLHLFHVDCIDMWLSSHSTCPVCRVGMEPPMAGALTSV